MKQTLRVEISKMYVHKNHAGFSIVEVVIVLAVVILLGYLGYVFVSRTTSNTTTQDTSQQPEASDVSSAPQIHSRTDLDMAATVLDDNDPAKSSDAAQLESELSRL